MQVGGRKDAGRLVAALIALAAAALALALSCAAEPGASPDGDRDEAPIESRVESRIARLDDASALWSFYKFHYIDEGRVVSLDEDHVTTSEGQGYAMLRAVWSDDPDTFARVWDWTKRNLQHRDDRLFAWKWKGRVLDVHSATDADTDIALALLLASRAFDMSEYEDEARALIADIWRLEILVVGDEAFPTAGDWALKETVPTLHVAYLAPYAYEEFAKVDSAHPWRRAVDTSYAILEWLYFERALRFPPEIIYVDRETGALAIESPRDGRITDFGYDAFPIYWRVALDEHWHGRWQGRLREQMLAPLRETFESTGALYDRYDLAGQARSRLEALPLYATAHSLATVEDDAFAERLRSEKLDSLWIRALAGQDTPYYLHNWLWFDAALDLGVARRYDEFLGFLQPFDTRSFRSTFPTVSFFACLLLFPAARFVRSARWRPIAVVAFLVPAFAVCLQYLAWRGLHSLNFVEPAGPSISLSLWAAEIYCFLSVVFLVGQVGLGTPRGRRRPASETFRPSVDVMIPVFHEPLEILERTLLAARAMRYAPFEVHVLDDGHRDEVRALADRLGVRYHRGPREHAKAGNLNRALAHSTGDLVVVFDTDHIPVRSFLEETVPWFEDAGVGFVQTPHHFVNPDIFQRAFRVAGRIPNEQDMFNHGIQSRRDTWGGAFFVGSGAVFRRAAIEGIGGFKLLSITEDIHTSQHLHAAGWRSVFVDRDLAVGLSAESLASYVVQRRRWMLGCLQIFFRDNPLFCRGLSLRQRLGYFASLYYFFFPLARIVFWSAPLAYLLFHWHPILSEVSVLTALLIPYLIILPMISAVLLPDWSRPFWGPFYENAVSAPLARSMFDLLLPRSLGFAVTPKGLVRQDARFDWRSTRWTLVIAGVTAFAIAKGLWEFWFFGIERDAYFFNLAWAGYNLVFLLAALLVAWERPQRRGENRVPCDLLVRIDAGDRTVEARTHDLSLSGCALRVDDAQPLPRAFPVEIQTGEGTILLQGDLVYHERTGGAPRAGVVFRETTPEQRRELLLRVVADPLTWADVHTRQARSQPRAAFEFVRAIVTYPLGDRPSRRQHPREPSLRALRVVRDGRAERAWLRSTSPIGLGIVMAGAPPRAGATWRIACLAGPSRIARVVHATRWLGVLTRVGLELIDDEDGRLSKETGPVSAEVGLAA